MVGGRARPCMVLTPMVLTPLSVPFRFIMTVADVRQSRRISTSITRGCI